MEPTTLMDQARDAFDQAIQLAQGWLLSPAAWSQFGLLIGAYLLARLTNRLLEPRIAKLLTPDTATLRSPRPPAAGGTLGRGTLRFAKPSLTLARWGRPLASA